MSTPLPLRVRAALALVAGAERAASLLRRAQSLVAELPFVIRTPALEEALAARSYGRDRQYVDVAAQGRGLHPFEERALAGYFPAPPARILLHGAGGGREALALIALGYTVDVLEPDPRLADTADRALAASSSTVRAKRMSAQAWADGWTDDRYDAAIMGWTSWSHLLRREDRVSVLAALRGACPSGPLLLSYFRHERGWDHREAARATAAPMAGLKRFTRTFLRERVLGLGPHEPGLGFARGMYLHLVDPAGLAAEAAETGWTIRYEERDAERYPHAVLI